MTTKSELAWAAGFIDGEGCFYACINNRGSASAILSISQRLREPLDYLRELFDTGSVCSVNNHGNPAFIYTIAVRHDLIRVIKQVKPYLRCKKDQAETTLLIAEHLVLHGGRGRWSTIDTGWCKTMCKELQAQKRPWLKNIKT